MFAAVLETESRSGHEILDGARHEDLARAGERRDAGADRDRDPDDLAVAHLAFARMETGAHVDADGLQRLAEGRGGEDRPGRAVEGREEPVTRGVELPSLEPRELATNDRVMLLQELAPSRVSEARRQLRRTHDVGEQDRGKHALRLVPSA